MPQANGNLDWFVGKKLRHDGGGYSFRSEGKGECVGWTVDEHGRGHLVVYCPGFGNKVWDVLSVHVEEE